MSENGSLSNPRTRKLIALSMGHSIEMENEYYKNTEVSNNDTKSSEIIDIHQQL